MRRIALFVGLALAIVFSLTVVNINQASGRLAGESLTTHDQGQNQHSNHQSNAQRPQPFVDGASNPGAIPDSAAREIVLRLLTSDELNEGQKRAYLKEVGFDEGASAALTFAAHDFKRQTEQIEKDASEIKDRTWPNPDKATLDQLAGLQRQKEAILANNAADLGGRLRSFNALANWENHITNRVKRKTKGFQVGMPMKKVGFLERIIDPFAAYAQAPGCDTNVFVYSDTYLNWDSEEVVGSTSYSVPANNCGHTFSSTTVLWGPGGIGGSGNRISLNQGSYFIDGLFHTNSDLEGFCPVVSETFYAGNNASDMTLAPFISVGPFQNWVPPGDITVNTTATASIRVTGSTDATGKTYQVSIGHDIVTGAFSMEVAGGATGTVPSGLDKTQLFLPSYRPVILVTTPARFKGVANVSSNQLIVRNSTRESDIKNIVPQ
jgi:hypothetical protein